MSTGPGVGLVGLGYMGRTHLAAYRAAAAAGVPNRVLAVCDRDRARLAERGARAGNLEAPAGAAQPDLTGLALHADLRELLADPEIALVDVCTPTDTHVALALAALEAGKHVLVEKPVALRTADVARLAAAARAARRHCLPAMCMRFWPGWDWLAATIAAGTHGAVRSAVFRRLAAPPDWSRGFYGDPARSGGALYDLHVHDADFVLHCFGTPASVRASGSRDHVTSVYRYADGPVHVVAEGAWDLSPGFPFSMGFTVVFEQATADYLHGREPLLRLARDGRCEAVPLPAGTGYDGEIRHALAVVTERSEPRVTLAQALELARLLEAEERSLASGEAESPR